MRVFRILGVVAFQVFLLLSLTYFIVWLGDLANQSSKVERIMKGVWSVSILIGLTLLSVGLGETLLWFTHSCSLLPYSTISYFSKASGSPKRLNKSDPIVNAGTNSLVHVWRC